MLRFPVLAIALAIATPALAQVQPGAAIPALQVKTDAGKPAAFKDIAGKNGAVIAFTRSAKWCPYCQAQLVDLKRAQGEIEKRGYKLAAISYDAPEVLAAFRARHDIRYALLSDKGSKTIDAFGIRSKDYPPGNMAYGVPNPAIYVVGADGRIQGRLAEAGYKTRPTTSQILTVIDAQ